MNALIVFICTVCFSVCALGLTLEVIKDQPGDALQCNSLVVISCKFAINTPIIKWKIAPDVQNTTITAATCFSNSCVIHSSIATTNYSFTFDKQVGVSNLTIKKVTFEIEKFEFQCDDSVTFVPVKYNVTEPPSKQTIIISNTTDVLRVETACVYPAENVIIKWYSRLNESSERIPHSTSHPRRTLCNISDDCILANKSENITSDLKLSQLTFPVAKSKRDTITSSQMRIFEVEIIYDSGNFSFVFGNFLVQDKTETSTYSTVKLTPTPTIVISSTPTPVITPTQTIVISPTPTTVVSPTSTIVVASSSTDKPSFTTKKNFQSPESNKSVIIASATGGVVFLVIIISAFVCCIKRRKRNKRKAKKYMIRKEDNSVQENKL